MQLARYLPSALKAQIIAENKSKEETKTKYVRPTKTKSTLADPRFLGTFDSWYFKILDTSYQRLAVYAIAFYGSICLSFALLTLPFVKDNIQVPGTNFPATESSYFGIALIWSVTHVITMGYGQFLPYDFSENEPLMGLFFLATVQQFAGILINVLAFSIMVTKIQHPSAAVVFANQALVTTRNNQRVLLFRLGNLRCNHIFVPQVRLSVLKMEQTLEGETYMKWLPLLVTEIPLVTAVCVAEHVITKDSPLADISEVYMADLANNTDFALSLTFTGRDGVYHDEICAAHRYFRDDIVFGKLRFGDTMEKIPASSDGFRPARVFANFNKISDFVEIGSDIGDDDLAELGGEGLEVKSMDGDHFIQPSMNKQVMTYEGEAAAPSSTSNQQLMVTSGSDVSLQQLQLNQQQYSQIQNFMQMIEQTLGKVSMQLNQVLGLVLHNNQKQDQLLTSSAKLSQDLLMNSTSAVMKQQQQQQQQPVAVESYVQLSDNHIQQTNHDQQLHPGLSKSGKLSKENEFHSKRAANLSTTTSSIFSTVIKNKCDRSLGGQRHTVMGTTNKVHNYQIRPYDIEIAFGQIAPDQYCLHGTNVDFTPTCIDNPEPNVVYLFCGGDIRGKSIPMTAAGSSAGTTSSAQDHDHLWLLGQEVGGLLAKSCSVSSAVDALLKAAKIPHQIIVSDMEDKPDWVVKVGKNCTTPAIIYNGRYLEESSDILELLCEEFGESHFAKFLEKPDKEVVEREFEKRKEKFLNDEREKLRKKKLEERKIAREKRNKKNKASSADQAQQLQATEPVPLVLGVDSGEENAAGTTKTTDGKMNTIEKQSSSSGMTSLKTMPVDNATNGDVGSSPISKETGNEPSVGHQASKPPVSVPSTPKPPITAAHDDDDDSPKSCGLPKRPTSPWAVPNKKKTSKELLPGSGAATPKRGTSGEVVAPAVGVGGAVSKEGEHKEEAPDSVLVPDKDSQIEEQDEDIVIDDSELPPYDENNFRDKHRYLHNLCPEGMPLPKFVMGGLVNILMTVVKVNVCLKNTTEALTEYHEVESEISQLEEELTSLRNSRNKAVNANNSRSSKSRPSSWSSQQKERPNEQGEQEQAQYGTAESECEAKLSELQERKQELLKTLEQMDTMRKTEIPTFIKKLLDLWSSIDKEYENRKDKTSLWLYGNRMSLDDVVILAILNVCSGALAFIYPYEKVGFPPQLPGLDLAKKPVLSEVGEKEQGKEAALDEEDLLLPPPYYFIHSNLKPRTASGELITEKKWEGRDLQLPPDWNGEEGTTGLSPVAVLSSASGNDNDGDENNNMKKSPLRWSNARHFCSPIETLQVEHLGKALQQFAQTDLCRAIAPGPLPAVWTRQFFERKCKKMFGVDLPKNETADQLAMQAFQFLKTIQNEIVIPEFIAANVEAEKRLNLKKGEKVMDGNSIDLMNHISSSLPTNGTGNGSSPGKSQNSSVMAFKKRLLKPPLFTKNPLLDVVAANKNSVLQGGGERSETPPPGASRFFEDMILLDARSFRLIHSEIMRIAADWNDEFEDYLRENGAENVFDGKKFLREKIYHKFEEDEEEQEYDYYKYDENYLQNFSVASSMNTAELHKMNFPRGDENLQNQLQSNGSSRNESKTRGGTAGAAEQTVEPHNDASRRHSFGAASVGAASVGAASASSSQMNFMLQTPQTQPGNLNQHLAQPDPQQLQFSTPATTNRTPSKTYFVQSGEKQHYGATNNYHLQETPMSVTAAPPAVNLVDPTGMTMSSSSSQGQQLHLGPQQISNRYDHARYGAAEQQPTRLQAAPAYGAGGGFNANGVLPAHGQSQQVQQQVTPRYDPQVYGATSSYTGVGAASSQMPQMHMQSPAPPPLPPAVYNTGLQPHHPAPPSMPYQQQHPAPPSHSQQLMQAVEEMPPPQMQAPAPVTAAAPPQFQPSQQQLQQDHQRGSLVPGVPPALPPQPQPSLASAVSSEKPKFRRQESTASSANKPKLKRGGSLAGANLCL
ncbi:unnamed protein product [Amoebophrya sp. A120]|nr:unnamed protein product [Amoebophrya sp. A120]|eukprot:GSA120T00007368001.1